MPETLTEIAEKMNEDGYVATLGRGDVHGLKFKTLGRDPVFIYCKAASKGRRATVMGAISTDDLLKLRRQIDEILDGIA